jgi:hypothetical protein
MRLMMNEKVAKILAAYIGISWLLAFLLFCHEFLIGPMFNVLSPQIAVNYNTLIQPINSSNLIENQVTTFINQLVPIPLKQFIIIELTLVIPSAILFGKLYYEATKEDHDE